MPTALGLILDAALGARVGLAEGVAVDGLRVEGAALIDSVVRIT